MFSLLILAKGPVLGGIDFVDLREHYELKNGFVAPVYGYDKHSVEFHGDTFWFLSEDNSKKFAASPSDYYPQFGGYSAWELTGFDANYPSG